MSVLFTRSASRHHISQARALYVLGHYIWTLEAKNKMTFYVGPDRNGIDLEIATAPGRVNSSDIYVVHAMRLSAKLKVEYQRRLGQRK